MSDLPSGTVTLLFCDMEGSTRILQQLGDDYPRLLSDQRDLLSTAFRASGGHEISSEGDGFFVVFSRAGDAVRAAVGAQRALAAHPWPRCAVVAVRMGLHSGEPVFSSGRYVGLDVHRAARICDAGHGGQVLLSGTTQDLVALDLPDGVELQRLGEHWLKDLQHPEQLYQLVIAGLPAEFPPVRAVNLVQTHLPALRTQLIGRRREVVAVCQLLRAPQVRLLTILGPGGVGKTRIAVAVTEAMLGSLEHGACFVALASLHNPDLVMSAIAQALDIRETGRLPLWERLIARLSIRPPLLVLDNFEHLTAAAPLLAELLMSCPELKIAVTSREALHLYGEHEFTLSPLAVPELGSQLSLEELASVPAVDLFVQRARAVRAGFTLTAENVAAVAEICVRLDGLPLAIELAAARVNVLSPAAILPRLASRLDLLTGGARDWPTRHRTLRGAIDWSFDLLDPLERLLFRRLAIFRGGWTLDAAEVVCVGDALERTSVLELMSHLVDKSLVLLHDGDTVTRYQLLETVREYGAERLAETGEDCAVAARHLEWALAFGEQAEAESYGPEHAAWLTRLEAEQHNLRAALAWSCRQGLAEPAVAETGLRLAVALWRFWEIRGLLSEGRAVIATLLPLASDRSPARIRATTLAAFMAMLQGAMEEARTLAEQVLAPARELGDPLALVFMSASLVNSARDRAELESAVALVEECCAVSRAAGSWFGAATALFFLGQVALATGDYRQAEALYHESLALVRDTGDRWTIAHPVARLGHLALLRGDYEQATARCRESLAARRDLQHARGIPEVVAELGWIAAAQGQAARAAQLLGAADVLRERAGTVVLPAFQSDHDRAVAAARASLGDTSFEASWAVGRALPERTIEYALAEESVSVGATPA
jgi:predicted ATPase/class 3 adenylate cyclase